MRVSNRLRNRWGALSQRGHGEALFVLSAERLAEAAQEIGPSDGGSSLRSGERGRWSGCDTSGNPARARTSEILPSPPPKTGERRLELVQSPDPVPGWSPGSHIRRKGPPDKVARCLDGAEIESSATRGGERGSHERNPEQPRPHLHRPAVSSAGRTRDRPTRWQAPPAGGRARRSARRIHRWRGRGAAQVALRSLEDCAGRRSIGRDLLEHQRVHLRVPGQRLGVSWQQPQTPSAEAPGQPRRGHSQGRGRLPGGDQGGRAGRVEWWPGASRAAPVRWLADLLGEPESVPPQRGQCPRPGEPVSEGSARGLVLPVCAALDPIRTPRYVGDLQRGSFSSWLARAS